VKKRVTYTLDEEVIKQLKSTSEKTLIPQARLVEQGILKVIKDHKGE
jgi:hypothetical protein